tara:strand:+ start:39 stop:395 length:357 start_codon:yes stop_codon:yes gene_type:complete
MIKQIFTWWNSQTVGTFINTIFFGRFVGKDNAGNKYYENRNGKRWVIYKGEINASKIDADWYAWMHYQTDIKPTETVIEKYEWQKPHLENKTGTKDSYKPNRISRKSKSFKKYENWKP